MSTLTTRFALVKPATTDLVDVAAQIDANFDTIDNALGFTPCTSSTRPSSPKNGQGIFETDTNRAYVYETAVTTWQLVGGMAARIAFGGDVTVTNTTTLTTVTALVLPMEKNTSYTLEGSLIYGSATAQDIKFDLSVPAGGQYVTTSGGLLTSTAATSGSIERLATYNASWTAGGAGVGTFVTSALEGSVEVVGTAGNLTLKFAQASAGATVTTLYGGSWIKLTRV